MESSAHSHIFPYPLFTFSSSSVVHFENCSKYLRGTVHIFIPLKFLLQSLVSKGFLVLRHSYFFHSFLHVKYSQVSVAFLLFKRSDSFMIWLFYSIHCFFFPTLHYLHGTYFLCQMPFLYPGSIFLLFVTKSPVLFFFFFANSLLSSMYIWCLIFYFCKFLELSVLPKYVNEWHHYYCK